MSWEAAYSLALNHWRLIKANSIGRSSRFSQMAKMDGTMYMELNHEDG